MSKIPEHIKQALKDYVDLEAKGNKVYCQPDPMVPGTYAFKIVRREGPERTKYTFHLLWSGPHQDLEEVEFTNWPPISGELKFQL